MKKLSFIFLLLWTISLLGQETYVAYKFTDEIILPTTSVKNQDFTGTCWSWSTISFLESEIMRIKGITNPKQAIELSPMYIVNLCYKEKAKNFVLWHGKVNFDEGGEPHDVICAIKKYGIVPYETYLGINYGLKRFNHKELNSILKAYLEKIINQNRLTTAWQRAFNAIVDEYMGKVPEKFNYKGKTYTPKSFMQEVAKINPNDYIAITSFSHHPFYKSFILEMPDNWAHKEFYNVPLDEMMLIINNALENGYTIAWGADVSEPYFSIKGIAVVPKRAFDTINGQIIPKQNSSHKKSNYDYTQIYEEMPITQELRQWAFEHYTTTDDHGMHIIGRAHDQNNNTYYIVKNSWSSRVGYNGNWYFSKNYVEYKTMSILVHKDAIPKDIRKKLGI